MKDFGAKRLLPSRGGAGGGLRKTQAADVLRFMDGAAGNKQKIRANNVGPDLEKRQLPTLPPGGAVPSAMAGLTSLFGMARGGTPPL